MRVRFHAMFLVARERDQDNLVTSLKWVLDCLKQRQEGSVGWRLGICDTMGYFVDDSPTYLELGDVWQNKASREMQQLVVEIEPLADGGEVW